MNLGSIRGEVLLNEPMSRHTSYRIGGAVDALVTPADRDDLLELLGEIRKRNIPLLVLGGGTNLLVRDGGFRGVAASLKKLDAIRITREYRAVGGTYVVVTAEAGAGFGRLVNFSVENALTGLEFAAGIPGTVGGAICMNAGTVQGEIGDVTDAVTFLMPTGEIVLRHRDEMAFRYRTANVPPGAAIIEVRIILRRGESEVIAGRIRKLQETRKERQPGGLPNAGSVFKNPPGEAAGKLIEQAGLKGLTVGRAQVSEKHANFIVNLGGATAADVLALMRIIQERVLEMHKVRLEPEIRIVGED